MNAGTLNLIDWMNVGKLEEYDEIGMTKNEGIRSNDYVNVRALCETLHHHCPFLPPLVL